MSTNIQIPAATNSETPAQIFCAKMPAAAVASSCPASEESNSTPFLTLLALMLGTLIIVLLGLKLCCGIVISNSSTILRKRERPTSTSHKAIIATSFEVIHWRAAEIAPVVMPYSAKFVPTAKYCATLSGCKRSEVGAEKLGVRMAVNLLCVQKVTVISPAHHGLFNVSLVRYTMTRPTLHRMMSNNSSRFVRLSESMNTVRRVL
mmetsp:Transcript_88515/g.285892  ORF Transcript_88515/g.285892 Transcript_88515/m.285892 type:complete len:205 (+) Transcript_88515:785-1399(+)